MTTQPGGQGQELLEKGGRVLSHVAAVVIGLVLMIVGLGLGVTLVMLPVGLVVGLIGVGAFVWGLVGQLGSDGKIGRDSSS